MSEMRTLRYRVARWLVHFAIHFIMPPGRARQELTAALWTWNMRVQATLAASERP
jgi:hypothetical protein